MASGDEFIPNPFPVQNYLQVAKDRSTIQWEDKEVFQTYLEWMFGALMELQFTLRDLKQLRSIDSAKGEQLDVIGRIVGQPREVIDSDMLAFFAFQGYPLAESYGDLNDPSVGGIFRSIDTPTTGNILLDDEQYRLFIKAKVVRNTTNVTPNEFLRFLSFVFGAETNNMIGEGTAEFTILIGKDLTPFEQALLTYESVNEYGQTIRFIPKPIGVRVGYGSFPEEDFFAFQGVPNAKGYGDLNDPSVGGRYASLFI